MSHSGPIAAPDGTDGGESGGFGCPMLVRGHALVGPGQRPLVRCSFGWSIHDERELGRCIATETSVRCWKAGEDHGGFHEAAFVASRAPKRRAASAGNGTATGTDQTRDDPVPVATPPARAIPGRRPGAADRPPAHRPTASEPVDTGSAGVAADHD